MRVSIAYLPCLFGALASAAKPRARKEDAVPKIQVEKLPKYAYVTMFIWPAAKAQEEQKAYDKAIADREQNNGSNMTMDWFRGYPKKMNLMKVRNNTRPRFGAKGVLDLAANLRRVGAKYPLIVLTNSLLLLAPETKEEGHTNLIAVPFNESDKIPLKCHVLKHHHEHFQKLNIFKMVEYDKMMWLDTDMAMRTNIDRHFDKELAGGEVVWGASDNYQCNGGDSSQDGSSVHGFCSAMMLFQPTMTHYLGLVAALNRRKVCWGDQVVIGEYFNNGGRKTEVYPMNIVNFERCHWGGKPEVVHYSGSPHAKRTGHN